MLALLKTVLERESVHVVEIIDDVFDDIPSLHDVSAEAWSIFVADAGAEEEQLVGDGAEGRQLATHGAELRSDARLLSFLWARRASSEHVGTLFKELLDKRELGRQLLEPLFKFLKDLELTVRPLGTRSDTPGVPPADLIFVDLVLGNPDDPATSQRSVERIRELTSAHATPPLVVLMSSSPTLSGAREAFRDEAALLGCQFRILPKAQISSVETLSGVLLELAGHYRDTRQLAEFVNAWRHALAISTDQLLRTIRRLDLRDYADMQQLVLNSQGESVGAFMLDAFDRFFHYLLESDAGLAAAARGMNSLNWPAHPAAQFLPAENMSEMVDGLMFHHRAVTDSTDELEFGDVFAVQRGSAWASGGGPTVEPKRGERQVLLLVTQPCDLLHGGVRRLLFLAGVARPTSLVHHMTPRPTTMPTVRLDGAEYVVEWDTGSPVTHTETYVRTMRSTGRWVRKRRLRMLYALQIQQLFAAGLSRVGTSSMFPPRHRVGVVVTYQTSEGTFETIARKELDDHAAVVLVGRDKKDEPIDRLVLTAEFVSELSTGINAVPLTAFGGRHLDKWKAALADREFLPGLRDGITYKRDGMATHRKAMQVYGPLSDKRPVAKNPPKFNVDVGPLVMTVEATGAAAKIEVFADLNSDDL